MARAAASRRPAPYVGFTGLLIDASGYTGGGTIAIGGGSQGTGLLAHATTVSATGAVLKADALGSGTGGSVVVWSDGDTNFAGSISARGGATGGDGGNVETSGHTLTFDQAQVDTTAALGKTGNWLLDPYDLTINSADGTAIGNALATSNVTLQTTASNTGTSAFGTVANNGSGNIIDAGAISWASANTLTLSAYNSISVNAAISASGAGSLILRADNTGNGTGTVSFGATGTAKVGGTASLYYDPTSYAAPTTYATSVVSGSAGTNAYMLVNSAANLSSVATVVNAGTNGGTYCAGE